MQANEVDLLEIVPADFIPVLRRDPDVTIGKTHGADQIMAIIVLNHAQPPFNNPTIRQAAQAAIKSQLSAWVNNSEKKKKKKKKKQQSSTDYSS